MGNADLSVIIRFFDARPRTSYNISRVRSPGFPCMPFHSDELYNASSPDLIMADNVGISCALPLSFFAENKLCILSGMKRDVMRSVLLLTSFVLFFEDLRWSQEKVVSAMMKLATKPRTIQLEWRGV